MTLQAPKHVRRPQRDALTGAPIEAGTLHYPVRTGGRDYARRPGYRERAGERVVVSPTRLHTNKPEGETARDGQGGRALGLEYSLFFQQYLQSALDEVKREERWNGLREAAAWWNSAYGCMKVRLRLLDLFPPADAMQIQAIVVAICRDQQSPDAVADRFGRTYEWVGRKANLCMKLAHMTRDQYATWRTHNEQRKVLV